MLLTWYWLHSESEQETNALESTVKPTKATVSGPWSSCTYEITGKKRKTLVFKTQVKHQHTGDDSASSKSSERLDTEKLTNEKVEGINALPRELLGTYIYLLHKGEGGRYCMFQAAS